MTKSDPKPARKTSPRPVRRSPAMAPVPPPPRKADMRRSTLIDAAIALLVDQGKADATIEEIAAQAGVAKGTFYHYFASKTALIDALREDFLDRFQNRLIQAVDGCPPDDWPGKLDVWVETATALCFEMQGLHDLVFHGPSMPHRQAICDADAIQHLAELLRDGESAKAWDLNGKDAMQIAAVIFHGLHGMADDALALDRPAGDLGTQLAHLYRRMVAG